MIDGKESKLDGYFRRQGLRSAKVGMAVILSCLMIGTAFGTLLTATTPGVPTVIEPGSMVSGYSYVIFKSGTSTYAKNGTSGAIVSSSTSSYSVIQSCLNSLRNETGGSIYLKLGTYTLTTALNITQRNLRLDADKGTVLTGTIMPLFIFQGHDFEYDFTHIYAAIEVSNIDFYYTGILQAGTFIHLAKAQPDNTYGTAFYFHDLKIHSNQPSFNVTSAFVGLGLKDLIGARFERLQIYDWGTGIQFEAGMNVHFSIPEDSEHNYFGHMDVTQCYYGIYEFSTGGHIYFTTYDTVKINQVIKIAMNSIDIGSTMIMPDFGEIGIYYDGTFQTALNVSGTMTINGGQIVSAHDVLINATNSHLIVGHVRLYGSALAFWLHQTYLTVDGNDYQTVTKLINSDTTYVVGINDAIETTAMGTATATGATNSVTVNENLIWWPWQVIVTAHENGTGNIWIGNKWGNQGGMNGPSAFEIDFANQPGASTWHFDWIAIAGGSI